MDLPPPPKTLTNAEAGVDCHGHYTTAPKTLEAWRNQQIAGIKDPSVMPTVADLKISETSCARRSRRTSCG